MNIHEKIADLSRQNLPHTVATVVKSSGSVPGKVGFKMVVEPGGYSAGTVGGGELEQRVVAECLKRLESGESALKEYILQEKATGKKKAGDAEVVPMMCNGKAWIFYEVHRHRTAVYVFGGGHVGQALGRVLQGLGLQLNLIDNREHFVDAAVNPHYDVRTHADYADYAASFTPAENSFIVIMTHGHGYDYTILEQIYRRHLNVQYVGVIASRSKAKELYEKLWADFGAAVDLSNLYAPIGLNIGGNTENEIAVSIAAEIQAVRYSRNVPHLAKEG